jgi:hypothetical protein
MLREERKENGPHTVGGLDSWKDSEGEERGEAKKGAGERHTVGHEG